MKGSTKKNKSILQIDHQWGHHVRSFALLVKMQIELTSHLK